MIVEHNLDRVGNTPVVQIKMADPGNINLYSKLEFCNPTGSVKDRAARYIIEKLLSSGEIDKNTTMIESSSGNFGISLSAYSKKNGLKFICVIDPHITRVNECLIRMNGARVIKVTETDEKGGYLLSRIGKVKQLLQEIDNSYWVNQYANPYNSEAYYHSLGKEICDEFEHLDYLFIGISSGGTITGVSSRVKEKFPDVKVVAVDIIGSVIFDHPPKKRYIPGIGSSMVPPILKNARIDDVVMMDEVTTIEMCHRLLKEHYIFAGGSSGSVYGAIKKYFTARRIDSKIDVLTLFPDRGERYIDTIYNEHWCKEFIDAQAGTQGNLDDILK